MIQIKNQRCLTSSWMQRGSIKSSLIIYRFNWIPSSQMKPQVNNLHGHLEEAAPLYLMMEDNILLVALMTNSPLLKMMMPWIRTLKTRRRFWPLPNPQWINCNQSSLKWWNISMNNKLSRSKTPWKQWTQKSRQPWKKRQTPSKSNKSSSSTRLRWKS